MTTARKPMYYAVWVMPGQKRPGLFISENGVSWSKIATFRSQEAAGKFDELMEATGGVREWARTDELATTANPSANQEE